MSHRWFLPRFRTRASDPGTTPLRTTPEDQSHPCSYLAEPAVNAFPVRLASVKITVVGAAVLVALAALALSHVIEPTALEDSSVPVDHNASAFSLVVLLVFFAHVHRRRVLLDCEVGTPPQLPHVHLAVIN